MTKPQRRWILCTGAVSIVLVSAGCFILGWKLWFGVTLLIWANNLAGMKNPHRE